MKMNKTFSVILLIMLFAIGVFAQIKPLAEARAEIKSFAQAEQFSILYDQSKYVTKADVTFDIVERKTPFSKIFKKFEFRLLSLFADKGVDTKPVRSTLCINTQSKKYYFSGNRNLTLILDNETINLGEADRSTEVKGRKIKENLCWEIDKALIQDLGTASNVGYQIGRVKGNLTSDKLQFFKDYAKLVQVDKK